MKNKNKQIFASFIVVWSLLVASCTRVEYEYAPSESIPTHTELAFKYITESGQEIPTEQLPDMMCVSLSRILNTRHYVWYNDCNNGSLSDYKTDTDNSFAVVNGEYYIIAFTHNTNLYQIDGLENFYNDVSVSMREIHATCPPISEEERLELYPQSADFNPSQQLINTAEPLMVAIEKLTISPKHVDGDGKQVVKLSPFSLTQKINFIFNIELDEGVEITDIYASISGLSDKVQLMSGQVSDSNAHKALFRLSCDQTLGAAGKYKFTGHAYVLGLFPSEDIEYRTGKGILNITIHASAGDKSRIFYSSGVNLKKEIENAQLMIPTEDRSNYRINPDVREVDLCTISLKIDKDLIIYGTGGQGTITWEDNQDGDINIET